MWMDERVWPKMKSKCYEEAGLWWGYADKKVGWLWELCRLVRGACIQCAYLSLASAETEGWEWCDWIWELWQQHVQESSGSVGAGWSETWADVTKRVAVVKLGVNSGSGDGGNWLLFVVLFGPLTLLTLQQKSIGSAKLLAPIISNFQCFCCCGAIWTWRTQKKADFAKKNSVYT